MAYAKRHALKCAINVRMDEETHTLWRNLIERFRRHAPPGVRFTLIYAVREILKAAHDELDRRYATQFVPGSRPDPTYAAPQAPKKPGWKSRIPEDL